MTRTLFLVDLDNLLRHDPTPRRGPTSHANPRMTTWLAGPGRWDRFDPRRPRARAVRVDASSGDRRMNVVTIAMNVETARVGSSGGSRDRVCAAYLQDLAGTLIDVFRAGPEYGLEIALTAAVAQAADVALVRLLTAAPGIEHAGAFERVVLISGDGGLRREIGARVTATEEPRGFDQAPRFVPDPRIHLDATMIAAWRSAGHPLLRTHEVVPANASPCDDFRTPGPVVYVESDAEAARAATEPLDTRGYEDIAAIARLADDAPAILTQIGPTRGSTRGVQRLTRQLLGLDGDSAPLGACRRDDGIELLRPNGAVPANLKIEGPIWRVDPSGVGDGSVRLTRGFPNARPTLALSVGTRLPTDVVRLAMAKRRRLELSDLRVPNARWPERNGARWEIGEVQMQLADDATLSSLIEVEPVAAGDAIHTVRFEPRGEVAFVTRIVLDTGTAPRAWWSFWNGKGEREWGDRTTAIPLTLRSRRAFDIVARLVLFSARGEREIGSVSTVADPGRDVGGVTVMEDAPPLSISLGSVNGKDVAIVNTKEPDDRTLKRGHRWTCRPIQFPGFWQRLVDRGAIPDHPALRRLPLLVPLTRERRESLSDPSSPSVLPSDTRPGSETTDDAST